jgi:hypothetical protein
LRFLINANSTYNCVIADSLNSHKILMVSCTGQVEKLPPPKRKQIVQILYVFLYREIVSVVCSANVRSNTQG